MTMDRRKKAARAIVTFFAATAVLYALLGGLLLYSAYAQQTRSTVFPTPNKPIFRVPTGSDDAAVKAFYDYNELRHVSSLEETYFIDPYYWETMYLVIGGILISLYFLAFSWYSRRRGAGDLYPVEVYNAYITERGGPIDAFNWASWSIILAYMVYYASMTLSFGQYY
jgi:hypothetical protein